LTVIKSPPAPSLPSEPEGSPGRRLKRGKEGENFDKERLGGILERKLKKLNCVTKSPPPLMGED